MKARSSDGPAGMVFDAVFNTPDVGSAPVVDPPPAEPPKQEEVSTRSMSLILLKCSAASSGGEDTKSGC